jgi:hypothetical protein
MFPFDYPFMKLMQTNVTEVSRLVRELTIKLNELTARVDKLGAPVNVDGLVAQINGLTLKIDELVSKFGVLETKLNNLEIKVGSTGIASMDSKYKELLDRVIICEGRLNLMDDIPEVLDTRVDNLETKLDDAWSLFDNGEPNV